MKKLSWIILLMVAFAPAWAQDEDTDPQASLDPQVRARFDAAKAAYITERLGLTPEESEKFWPIYREFADKRLQLREQFKEARRSGKTENELVELNLKLKQQELDLEKDYSGRLMNVITAQKLMNLRVAEREFHRIIVDQLRQRQMQQERRQLYKERQQQRMQQRNN